MILIHSTLRKFASEKGQSIFQRSEHVISEDVFAILLQELSQLGLVPYGEAQSSSLLDLLTEPSGLSGVMIGLAILAEVNPALSYAVLQRSLAHYLGEKTNLTMGNNSVIALEILSGPGKRHLEIGFLESVSDEDRREWGPVLYGSDPFLLQADPGWETLIRPLWDQERFVWGIFSRTAVESHLQEGWHGLSECPVWEIHLPAEVNLPSDRPINTQDWREIQTIQWLGLVAIALGAVKAALSRAWDYGENRRQGGQPIIRHSAVQDLWGTVSGVVATATRALTGFSEIENSLTFLYEVAAMRSFMQPALSEAASNALQIFGGMGYMEDMGMEKILRDVNQLRLLGGTPAELKQLLAALKRECR